MSDVFRMLFVDLRDVRQVSEMGVDFGSANERLPKVRVQVALCSRSI